MEKRIAKFVEFWKSSKDRAFYYLGGWSGTCCVVLVLRALPLIGETPESFVAKLQEYRERAYGHSED